MATEEAVALSYQYGSQPSGLAAPPISNSGGLEETPRGSLRAGRGYTDVTSPGPLSWATGQGRVDREVPQSKTSG